MILRPRRSVLYLPGSNARALDKAATLAADALILDLEDAVAPDAKAMARTQVCDAVRRGFGQREVAIRINSLDSDWANDDLAAAIAARPDAIVIPKVNDPGVLARVAAQLGDSPIALWAMIETARAIMNLNTIAAAGGRLAALVVGSNDLIKEMGAAHLPDRSNLAAALSFTVLAARAHGLGAIDGVHNAIADTEGFAAACAQGRAFGFDGKTVIHPSQIEAANAAFSPTPDEVDAARKIIAAFDRPENRGKGAIALDGHMVERLHAESARRTVALSEAIAAA